MNLSLSLILYKIQLKICLNKKLFLIVSLRCVYNSNKTLFSERIKLMLIVVFWRKIVKCFLECLNKKEWLRHKM